METAMHETQQIESPWLVAGEAARAAPVRLRLFCFHYAGSTASIFRGWQQRVPDGVEVLAIQLPGREYRLAEPLLSEIDAIVDALKPAVAPLLDVPYVFFGHSMGALIAFDLIRALRESGLRQPELLIASGRSSPRFKWRDAGIETLPDEAFIAAVRSYSGIPEALIADPAMRDLWLPRLRADLTISARYTYAEQPPLGCPILVQYSEHDALVSEAGVRGWSDETTGVARFVTYEGNHFFLHGAEQRVLADINAELETLLSPANRACERSGTVPVTARDATRDHAASTRYFNEDGDMERRAERTRVAILGSGNIGIDLMFKVGSSEQLELACVVGRNRDSSGLALARECRVPTSSDGLAFLKENADAYDIVFDATSASAHAVNSVFYEQAGKFAINLTPARVGRLCVPSINLEEADGAPNINLITCGGQASLPIAHAVRQAVDEIEYLEVVSTISSRSAGMATRENIDEYLNATEYALARFGGAAKTKAILNINPAEPGIDMQTTLYIKARHADFERVKAGIAAMVERVRQYVPTYKLVIEPIESQGRIMVGLTVRGRGDYLPEYAGNLDIINCAAIAVAVRRHASMLEGVNP